MTRTALSPTITRLVAKGMIVLHEREEAEACPVCKKHQRSYSYTNPRYTEGVPFDRRWCLCGYAEAPLHEEDRGNWMSAHFSWPELETRSDL